MKKVLLFAKKHSIVLEFVGAILIWTCAFILLGLFPAIANNRYLFALLTVITCFGGGYLFCQALVEWMVRKYRA